MSKRKRFSQTIVLLIVALCGLNFGFCQSLAAETFLPAPTDASAHEIIEQLLKVNRVWLEPNPILASYRLIKGGHEDVGSFEVNGESDEIHRLGVTLNTPLHALNRIFKQPNVEEHVSLTVLGVSNRSLVIEVEFLTSAENGIGFMTSDVVDNPDSQYPLYNCRIYFNPDTYTPDQIITTSQAGFVEPFSVYETWSFNNRFYEMDIGVYPNSINWSTYETVVDFIFQYTDGVWIFLEGASWYSETNPSGMSGVIDHFQLLDLVVTNPNLNETSQAEFWNLY